MAIFKMSPPFSKASFRNISDMFILEIHETKIQKPPSRHIQKEMKESVFTWHGFGLESIVGKKGAKLCCYC